MKWVLTTFSLLITLSGFSQNVTKEYFAKYNSRLPSSEGASFYRLITYAEEGVDLAMNLDSIVKGSDLAVWILRSNIYLRSYDRNTEYYELLKELYESGQINQDK